MNKKSIICIIIGIGAAVVLGAVVIRNATPTIIEDRRTNNADEYSMEFTGKRQSGETVFTLKKGEELEVSYQVEKGKADLVIGISGEKPIYMGNGITDGDFTVTADQTGEYVVFVEAKNAA